MVTVTVSAKFQVVIPKEVREQLGIWPGQRLQVLPFSDRFELVPLPEIQPKRGFLEGIDTDISRKEDRA
jgi:AbrB family looped-hinge helix DNA binding protein